MKIMQKTSKVVELVADEGKWLTRYTENQDITAYLACKRVSCLMTKASAYREITDAEHQAYMERYEMAIASEQDEEPEA